MGKVTVGCTDSKYYESENPQFVLTSCSSLLHLDKKCEIVWINECESMELVPLNPLISREKGFSMVDIAFNQRLRDPGFNFYQLDSSYLFIPYILSPFKQMYFLRIPKNPLIFFVQWTCLTRKRLKGHQSLTN